MAKKKFSDSDATRIIAALEARQDRKVRDHAQVATTWGTIGAVDAANKFASAYLFGETDGAYMSEGFRIPEAMYLTVGDKVKVAINYATGDRWITEAHFPTTTYKKLVLDLAAGVIKQGDGSAPPATVDLSILSTITAFIETLLDDVDAAAARTTLGLGSLATQSSIAHSDTTGQTATDHHPAPAAGPDANIAIDAAGSAGTAATFARSGHGHQVVTTDAPSGANITIDAAPSAAATGAIARAAHGHRLNTSSATPVADQATGSAGTSTTAPSRGDHRHPRKAPVVNVYTGNATWNKPSDIHHIVVEVQGGGAGGGGAATTGASTYSGGGGGGGGGYAKKTFSAAALASDTTFDVVVAASVSGGSGNAAGTAGNLSSFAGTGITTVQGNGGAGGESGAATSGFSIRDGGAGGSASGGDVNIAGGDAGLLILNSARTQIAPGGSAFLGGAGGPSGTDGGGAGAAGHSYGGGGAGAHAGNSVGPYSGGGGAAGVVIVTEYY